MDTLTLSAPAKINYLLDVIGKRPDGYHDLRMIMQRVNLCDDITLTLTNTPGIKVTCNSKGAPDGPENIAWKAARETSPCAYIPADMVIGNVQYSTTSYHLYFRDRPRHTGVTRCIAERWQCDKFANDRYR